MEMRREVDRQGAFRLGPSHLLSLMFRQSRLIFGVPAVAFVVALLAAEAQSPRYDAQVIFTHAPLGAPPAGRLAWAMDLGLIPDVREGILSARFYAGLVVNRGFLRSLADREIEVSVAGTEVRGTVAGLLAADSGTPDLDREGVLRLLGRSIIAVSERQTLLVYVRVRTRDPALSEAIAGALSLELEAFDVARRDDSAREERRFVERRLQEVEAELRTAESSLSAFVVANRHPELPPSLEAELRRRTNAVAAKAEVFVALRAAREEARAVEGRALPAVRIIQRPEGSAVRLRSRTLILGVTAVLLGFSIGLGIALVREFAAHARESERLRYKEFARLAQRIRLRVLPLR
jgi:uncharacterized protein involved in exopolysaccharide biosynthesis